MSTKNKIHLIAILCIFAPVILFTQPQHNGLRATLSAESTTVHMGACIEFHLELAFDSLTADANTRILNRYQRAWKCDFSFVNEKTGDVFTRIPYDIGMLVVPEPGDLVYLHNDSLFVEKMIVYLLSDEGNQIPPGSYQVRARYENDDGDDIEAYVDPDSKQYQQRPYPGPWSIWKGQIESAPLRLEVLPAGPAGVEMLVPSAIVLNKTQSLEQVGWAWSDQSPDTILIEKRPGYALGRRWNLQVQLNGEEMDYNPRGEGGMPWSTYGMHYFPRDISLRIRSGEELCLAVDLAVFESSVQSRHSWMPERGDFKILWSRKLDQKFP
jgi:hypothetical protein